jgi:hypothetical protein
MAGRPASSPATAFGRASIRFGYLRGQFTDEEIAARGKQAGFAAEPEAV